MKKNSLKHSIAVISTSSALIHISAPAIAADVAVEQTTDSLPNATAISTPSKAKIQAWINEVKMSGTNLKPSEDPDYSEFWIEMKPADPDNVSLPSPLSIEKPLSAIIKLQNSPLGISGQPNKNDLSSLIQKKANLPGNLMADWSEEAWAEIGPDPTWAEMAGPEDAEMINGVKLPNGKLTFSAKDKGKPVPNDYYKAILDEINKNN